MGPHVPGWGFARMAVALARRRHGITSGSAANAVPRDQCERYPAAYPVSREFHSILAACCSHMEGIMPIYRRPHGRWIPASVHL